MTDPSFGRRYSAQLLGERPSPGLQAADGLPEDRYSFWERYCLALLNIDIHDRRKARPREAREGLRHGILGPVFAVIAVLAVVFAWPGLLALRQYATGGNNHQSHPPRPTFPVGIDLSGLSFTQVRVDGSAMSVTAAPLALRLTTGRHVIQVTSVAGAPAVTFQVDSHGRVGYDSQEGPFVTGRGTKELRITGVAFTIDLTSSSYEMVDVDGTNPTPARVPRELDVLPGRYVLELPGFPSNNSVPFTVTGTGAVQYDRAYDGLLAGLGTSTLGVICKTVTINATAWPASQVGISGVGLLPAGTPQQVHLVPGDYAISLPGIPHIAFQVTSQGKVTYGADEGTELTGKGTGTLSVSKPHGS